MFRDKIVEIWQEDNDITVDDYGTRTKGEPTFIKTIMATVQPYSRDKLLKNYGYDLLVTKVVYCDLDSAMVDSSILKYNGDFYKVKKIMEWDNHLEVFCDRWDLKLVS